MRSQKIATIDGNTSKSIALLEEQLQQVRSALAGKADAQGVMALQAVVARKADTDDLHRLQASLQSLAGTASDHAAGSPMPMSLS